MNELFEILPKLNNKKALLIGDAMLDICVSVRYEKPSAEAAIDVYAESDISYNAGGAANVAAGLTAAGFDVDFLTVIGEDNEGERLLSLLKEAGVGTSYLVRDNTRCTTLKRRYYGEDNRQLFRCDTERTVRISPEIEKSFFDIIKVRVPLSDIVIISDYAKGVVTRELVSCAVTEARAAGVPILVDPKSSDYTKYRGCNIIKPNEKELLQMCGGSKNREEMIKAAIDICESNDNDKIIVTLGAEGMLAIGKDGEICHSPSERVENGDVCGAGDTSLSYLAAGIVADFKEDELLALANSAAAEKLLHKGAYAVTPVDLLKSGEQTLTLRDARTIREIYKNKRIVFTNGCFDILHKGHVASLKAAAALGDILVVGINSDASVRAIKGEGRPVLNLDERISVLSALSFVDFVIPFEELTPMKLLEALMPDILVKGGQYNRDTVVGADFVESYGGCVRLVEMVEGISTTDIIKRLKNE